MADGKETHWTVGITDYIQPPADIEQQAFPEAEFVFLGDTAEDGRSWRAADALLVWHYPIDDDLIPFLQNCRIVIRYGVGYDTVDVEALTGAHIPFCNTPDYGTEEVADAACAMILALQRNTVRYDRACRCYETGWQEHRLKSQQRTSACCVGIIGVGRIGTAVALRLKPFGFRLLGYDPYKPSGHEKAVGYERTRSLGDLLSQADIVTIHCPLTEETRGMVNGAFFDAMKAGASLVNTARGGLLKDLDCLEEALRTDHLASAAMDVLPSEPPEDHPLLSSWRRDEPWLRGRLIVNPHVAWFSQQGWGEMRYKAAETARICLLEGALRNQILPDGPVVR